METKTRMEETSWSRLQHRLFRMVSIGTVSDPLSLGYDIFSSLALIVNLTAAFMMTYDHLAKAYGTGLTPVLEVTTAFFGLDYVLRLLTAECLYPNVGKGKAMGKYAMSGAGLIDLLSFLPAYLPIMFPGGATAFRMFRVARILRLFRINRYYDSLNVISQVLVRKRQQLLSSFFIILVLMLASSLCLYSVEHDAQPEVFRNAFSGIWWSASTLLTIGYGDIYPITVLGKTFGILIAFLGVGMVAIPTGIISAGFVEQYQRIQKLSEYGLEADIHFVQVMLKPKDEWCGRLVRETALPAGLMIAVILRGTETKMPHGDVRLRAGDRLILSGESPRSNENMELKEIVLHRSHPWVGERIRSLDISRRSFIVLLKRHGRGIVPKGNVTLMEGDRLTMYTIKEGAEESEELPRPIV